MSTKNCSSTLEEEDLSQFEDVADDDEEEEENDPEDFFVSNEEFIKNLPISDELDVEDASGISLTGHILLIC